MFRVPGTGLTGGSIQLEWVRASTEAAQKVKRIALHQMVIRDGALILEVLAGVNQSLSASQNALFALDPGLDIPDRVGRIDLEGDGLARECPDKDLQPSWCQRQGSKNGGSGRR